MRELDEKFNKKDTGFYDFSFPENEQIVIPEPDQQRHEWSTPSMKDVIYNAVTSGDIKEFKPTTTGEMMDGIIDWCGGKSNKTTNDI